MKSARFVCSEIIQFGIVLTRTKKIVASVSTSMLQVALLKFRDTTVQKMSEKIVIYLFRPPVFVKSYRVDRVLLKLRA